MIMNLYAQKPTITVDISKCIVSQYASGGTTTTINGTTYAKLGKWANWNIQDISTSDSSINDGDDNGYYIGTMNRSGTTTKNYWATRFTIHMPTDLPNTCRKLVLKMKCRSGYVKCNRVRAYLTDDVPDSEETGTPNILANKSTMIQSYLYADPDGATRQTTDMTADSYYYFVFNFASALRAGVDYYVYIYPYANDSDAYDKCDFNLTATNSKDFTTCIKWANYASETGGYIVCG